MPGKSAAFGSGLGPEIKKEGLDRLSFLLMGSAPEMPVRAMEANQLASDWSFNGPLSEAQTQMTRNDVVSGRLTDTQARSWAQSGMLKKGDVTTRTKTHSEPLGERGAGSMLLERRTNGCIEVYGAEMVARSE